jgi:hypothetical protein
VSFPARDIHNLAVSDSRASRIAGEGPPEIVPTWSAGFAVSVRKFRILKLRRAFERVIGSLEIIYRPIVCDRLSVIVEHELAVAFLGLRLQNSQRSPAR